MHNSALQTPQRPWAHPSMQLRMSTRTEHSRWSHQNTPRVHTGSQAPCTHSHTCTWSPAELQARSPQKESVLAPSPSDTGSTSAGYLPSLPMFWPQQVPSSAGNLRELHTVSPADCRPWGCKAVWSRDKRQGAGNVEPREGRDW